MEGFMARHPMNIFLKQKDVRTTPVEEGRSPFIEKTLERLSKEKSGTSFPQEFYSRYLEKEPG